MQCAIRVNHIINYAKKRIYDNKIITVRKKAFVHQCFEFLVNVRNK